MRALAVLMVVAAHARMPGVAGGFTGVDVFFVISGFLITRLLLDEMASTGRVDLIRFWARRARRLLPNAYATLLGTVLLALFLFPGYSPYTLAREIMFAALEAANFHFAAKGADYFQSDGAASPVLHFWSLAVEEQFYLVWPPTLLVVGLLSRGNVRRATLIVLALIVVVSFTASLHLTATQQPTAYFHLGPRCWQLGVGALLATGWAHIMRIPPILRAAAAWLGLAAVLIGVAIIGEGGGYPGFWALFPTLGAAGLLAGFEAAAPSGLLRRGLGQPAMQWLGARSYSWYLWHWPLLALPRIALGDSPYIEAVAVPASLIVASAAYAWLENPMRRSPRLAAAPRGTLAGAAAGLCAVVIAGYGYIPALSIVNSTLSARFKTLRTAEEDKSQAMKDRCQLGARQLQQPECLYGAPSASRRAVLFGDSHAAHWSNAVERAAADSGWRLNVWTKASCPAIDVLVMYQGSPYTRCSQWRESIMARLMQDAPDLVIISNNSIVWKHMADEESGQPLPETESAEAFRRGARKTIGTLLNRGISVLIIRDTPLVDQNYQACYLAGGDCATPRERALAQPQHNVEVAHEFGDRVIVADFTDAFCDSEKCPLIRDGVFIYRDDNHISASYAATLAPQMSALLRAVAEKRAPEPQGVANAPSAPDEEETTSALGARAPEASRHKPASGPTP